jgi:hypothetical protein
MGDFNFTDKANNLRQIDSDRLNRTVFAGPDYERRRLEQYGNNAHKLKEQRYQPPPDHQNNQRGGHSDQHMGSSRSNNASPTMYNSTPMGMRKSAPSRASTSYNYPSHFSSPFQRNFADGCAPTMTPPIAPRVATPIAPPIAHPMPPLMPTHMAPRVTPPMASRMPPTMAPPIVFHFNTGSRPSGPGLNFSMAPPSTHSRDIVRPEVRFSDRDDRASNRTRYDSYEDSHHNAPRRPSTYRRERSYEREASPSPPRHRSSQTRRGTRHTYASPSPPRRGSSQTRRSSHHTYASPSPPRRRQSHARRSSHHTYASPSPPRRGQSHARRSPYDNNASRSPDRRARRQTATSRGHRHEDEFTSLRSNNNQFLQRPSPHGNPPSSDTASRVVVDRAMEMIHRNGRISRRARLWVNDSASPPSQSALVNRMTRDGQPLAPSVLGKRRADDDKTDGDEPAPKRNTSQKQRAKAAGRTKPQEGHGGGGGYTG